MWVVPRHGVMPCQYRVSVLNVEDQTKCSVFIIAAATDYSPRRGNTPLSAPTHEFLGHWTNTKHYSLSEQIVKFAMQAAMHPGNVIYYYVNVTSKIREKQHGCCVVQSNWQ